MSGRRHAARSALLALLVALGSAAGVDWEAWESLMAQASRLSTQGEFRAALPLAMRAVEHSRRGGTSKGKRPVLDGTGEARLNIAGSIEEGCSRRGILLAFRIGP